MLRPDLLVVQDTAVDEGRASEVWAFLDCLETAFELFILSFTRIFHLCGWPMRPCPTFSSSPRGCSPARSRLSRLLKGLVLP